jgi:2-polyprenyl-3-methyl-5-hydroxy-6-metoxy-1,4-benzoquinol methylase
MWKKNEALREEAEAFDKRITERCKSGFVPDLRRAVKCDYFYKSFWREPLFIQLYLGWIVDNLLDLLQSYCGSQLRILEVGCGAGYISLELARNGYHVMGIDISEASIMVAEETARKNPYLEGFGSLKYKVEPFLETSGTYDIILFCGAMHHMENLKGVVAKVYQMLPFGSHLLCYEPSHERFRKKDAAQVALIRGLLSLTGFWYDSQTVIPSLNSEKKLEAYIDEIHSEYILERDKDEPEGQSPHDLEAGGEEILYILRSRFTEIEVRPGSSFIYRLLGGIRGPEKVIHSLAKFVTCYERLSIKKGYLRENAFYFLGQKIEDK